MTKDKDPKPKKQIDDEDIDDMDWEDDDLEENTNDDKNDNVDGDDIDLDIIVDDIVEDDTDDDDTDLDDPDDDDDDDTVYFKFNTTSHKIEGKHRLKRDTIFYGKLNEESEEDEILYYNSTSEYYNKDFPIERGTVYEDESRNYGEVESQRLLKKDIYNLLKAKTDLDFDSNRRKPNKQSFNSYYEMLLKNLNNNYTKSEIFVELSYYFTDHIFNMYKLLYPQYATSIIMELREKGYLDELDDMMFV